MGSIHILKENLDWKIENLDYHHGQRPDAAKEAPSKSDMAIGAAVKEAMGAAPAELGAPGGGMIESGGVGGAGTGAPDAVMATFMPCAQCVGAPQT